MRRSSEGDEGARLVYGWGRTAPTLGHVRKPGSDDNVLARLRDGAGEGRSRGLIARGMGRSYGDAAQCAGGVVLDMTDHDDVRAIDLDTAVVEVDAGITLDRLLRTVLPLGLTLPVQPGTRLVTVGGAVACDVHGKNHHSAGSFSRYVRSLVLATADGAVRRLIPAGEDGELFWGTVGGMGLTGVILRVELQLRRVETSRVLVSTERQPDLASVMASLRQRDQDSEYTVAWFDSLARGASAGRGIVLSGRDAKIDDLPAGQRADPLGYPASGSIAVPRLPLSAINRVSGRFFNESWFRRAPRRPTTTIEHAFSFFQPLDGLHAWNRLYGPRGLLQYQLVVPESASDAVPDIVTEVAASGHVSCLNVLKRFGPGNQAPLSFPTSGWTLALDFPLHPGLRTLLDRLDTIVLQARGRIYLAKDSRIDCESVRAMYPRWEEFSDLLRRVDPGGVFASDLSSRLGLHPRRRHGGMHRA